MYVNKTNEPVAVMQQAHLLYVFLMLSCVAQS